MFVKSQDYLNVETNESENSGDSNEQEEIGNDIGADVGKGKKYMDDDEDATRIDA